LSKENYDYRYFRSVKGDGNCFYRSVGFAYLERLVLFESTARLRDLICWIQDDYSYYNLEDPDFEESGKYLSWREAKRVIVSHLAALIDYKEKHRKEG